MIPHKITLIGSLVWGIGFLMVMAGGLVRGPALGIGTTIEQPQSQDHQLEYAYGDTIYHITLTEPATVIQLTPHYTQPLADWDSILLLGQDLKVESESGRVVYQTDTTRLRLAQPAWGGYSVGQVADGLVWMGTVASLIGPLLVMARGPRLLPVLWVAVVMAYLVV